jgi:glycosyltransferase involved in cell wall biosynthesis
MGRSEQSREKLQQKMEKSTMAEVGELLPTARGAEGKAHGALRLAPGASRIVHFHRRPAAGQVSIERVFAQVRRALPSHLKCEVRVSPWLSRGIVRRTANLCHAARNAGQLNHITGDAHYLALALEGRRTLLTIHDCVGLERLRGLKRAVFRWCWYVLPLRRVAMVSVVSESVRRELLRHVPCDESKLAVVHDCVGDEFTPVAKSFDAADPVVLQVGTGPNKNLARTIPALAGLRCRFNIIGRLTREQMRWLDECGIRYSNVPHASDAELLHAYRQADVVMFASTYEGFGLPILEGNATGRPVVTSNLLSMPEVAGAAACLVNPFEVASIRAGVIRVLSKAGYRENLITAGFENVKRFTAKKTAADYAALYRKMMEFENPIKTALGANFQARQGEKEPKTKP